MAEEKAELYQSEENMQEGTALRAETEISATEMGMEEFVAQSICFRADGAPESDLCTFLGTTIRLTGDAILLDFSTSEYASAGNENTKPLYLKLSSIRAMMVGTRISEAFLAFSAEGFEQILIEPQGISLRKMEHFLKALLAITQWKLCSRENGCDIYAAR